MSTSLPSEFGEVSRSDIEDTHGVQEPDGGTAIRPDAKRDRTAHGLPIEIARRLGDAMACIAYGWPLPEWYRG